jgi:hypothetical protein
MEQNSTEVPLNYLLLLYKFAEEHDADPEDTWRHVNYHFDHFSGTSPCLPG